MISRDSRPILNSPIPADGRRLTSTEAARLRADGVSCSRRWYVFRRGGLPYLGTCYQQARAGGLDNTGVIVELNTDRDPRGRKRGA